LRLAEGARGNQLQNLEHRHVYPQESFREQKKLWPVVQVAAGNFLEMYDFMVFGYYAASIGRAFFPGGSDFNSLMKSLMTFGAGYLMRPLGALFLGAYVDRAGRRKGLLLTLGLMALGTLSIVSVPSYAVIGVIAPILVLLGRLVQGLSAGVELGGVSVYLAEIATPGRKGFFVSWQSASQQVAVMLAAVVGIGLGGRLSESEMVQWGWRIPLVIGCLILPFLYALRRSLQETDDFARRKHHPSTGEIFRSLLANLRLVLPGIFLAALSNVTFYLITAYTPTFGAETLRMPNRSVQIVLLSVGLSNFVWLPLMGLLTDRVGRRLVLVASSLMLLVTSYPIMLWLVSSPSFERLLAAELWISFLYAAYNGAMVVYLVEVMPPEARTTGFSLAYSLGTALFGGFTPAVCTYLISVTGNRAFPGLWLSFAAVLGFLATIVLARMTRAES
jgi:MFS family permease